MTTDLMSPGIMRKPDGAPLLLWGSIDRLKEGNVVFVTAVKRDENRLLFFLLIYTSFILSDSENRIAEEKKGRWIKLQ